MQSVARASVTFALLLAACLPATPCRGTEPASRYVEPYPAALSKKGLQVEDVSDALALGVKHAALNVNLAQVIAVDAIDGPSWTRDGRTFYFSAKYLQRLDDRIDTLSRAGVVVHLIVLAYASDDARVNKILLHPAYDSAAPNRLGAFNSVTPEGRAWLAATMEFLAERWSRPDRRYGRVAGYIVGNEVNSHWWWSNRGRATMQEFSDDYLEVVRLMHAAIRSQSSWARVYVSLEHHWSIRYPAGDEMQSFPAREFIDYFAAQAREDGDFDWHIAFHPYPENLFEPRFWNDTTAQLREETPRITFKNLEVLTEYLRRKEWLYEGKPRRIILSEQGFHTPDGPDGEQVQAAAYCLAYKQIEQMEGIDAFILHRHVDNLHEGGLRLGLRTSDRADPPRRAKAIYECFRLADTPEWEAVFEFALPIAGKTSWDEGK